MVAGKYEFDQRKQMDWDGGKYLELPDPSRKIGIYLRSKARSQEMI